ncbi:antibiotic biosynthesis monooxygenase family protein [Pseudoalteromonas luteoviolacea]|uniref:antibiotic biosynthesis monooxygenase family protein n=1 Tax=Pseudoalteromonas luteoviolacea TaxID=43657 RepID=UPI001151AA95|nr:antibiotic biosynthesis monooxygenase [Pseudoalteromonas luteoviolacea]TQF71092.1 antibiotic biosynthesis monooxygenase [Pseudoalteromonas luteoviolacea]
MIAVIFEVTLKPNAAPRYFDIAGELKKVLVQQSGFISIERYQNVNHPEQYLSLSYWQDKESVMRWRNQIMHQDAQHIGKTELFAYYRLRVANVFRDYSL